MRRVIGDCLMTPMALNQSGLQICDSLVNIALLENQRWSCRAISWNHSRRDLLALSNQAKTNLEISRARALAGQRGLRP
jgi:hypothetical protein